VGCVENADIVSYGHVFLAYVREPDRHLPACEVHDIPIGFVPIVQLSPLKQCSHLES
jgi:hypothetical protein